MKIRKITSELTQEEIEDFWIKVYFDTSQGFQMAAIKRAYRDFNRTLEDFPKKEKEKEVLRNQWIAVLEQMLSKLLSITYKDQDEFDKWHQSTCYKLRTANPSFKLSQGQAQKWINMTLKYLFALGEKRVKGVTSNYRFYHIPIDNIIQSKLEDLGIERFKEPWSKIHHQDSYMRYQKQVRELFEGHIPMDMEFKLFNKQ